MFLRIKNSLILGCFFIFSGFITPVIAQSAEGAAQVDWAAPLQKAQTHLAEKNYTSAYAEFAQQAQLGNGLAQFNLALFYRLGWGRPRDLKQACYWFGEAAQNNLPVAQLEFGICELNSHREDAQHVALQWFNKAQQSGMVEAGCRGGLLQIALGPEQTKQQGVQRCVEAANAGSAFAQTQVGKWTYFGEHTTQDLNAAFQWFSAAAAKQQGEAAFYLAQFYDQGLGMDIDARQALYWYEMAASQHYADAYFPTAILYWQRYQTADSDKATYLAKSYLWVQAALHVSLQPQTLINQTAVASQSQALLAKIKTALPSQWIEQLDTKVSQHFQTLQ
ncbi:MAG: sel1 repeat family protein [Paraglaciecola sp.]|nr:sel1 repeat family protein [Paraglaciecola sp.]NCT48172.1 sel1 repeat family protein [Paraglaciecola sp.]